MADDFDIEAMLEAPYRKVGDLNMAVSLNMNWLFCTCLSSCWNKATQKMSIWLNVSQVCLSGRENDVMYDASANDLNYK